MDALPPTMVRSSQPLKTPAAPARLRWYSVPAATVRFSGVTVDQVLRHYQRADGCRSASVVATGCRRCRHRCRQIIRWRADLDPGRGPSPYHRGARRSSDMRWSRSAHRCACPRVTVADRQAPCYRARGGHGWRFHSVTRSPSGRSCPSPATRCQAGSSQHRSATWRRGRRRNR